MRRLVYGAALALLTGLGAPSAVSAQTFAGSWRVDQGPNWGEVAQTYTGLQAAALLFGGLPSDYFISTMGPSVALINNMAWYSTWGGNCDGNFPCGTQYAENFSNSATYVNPGDVSAYVQDWAIGEQYTNYAFLNDNETIATPEPASIVLMATGLLGIVGVARRRKQS